MANKSEKPADVTRATPVRSPEDGAMRRHARATRELRLATAARIKAAERLTECEEAERELFNEEAAAWAEVQALREAAAKAASKPVEDKP